MVVATQVYLLLCDMPHDVRRRVRVEGMRRVATGALPTANAALVGLSRVYPYAGVVFRSHPFAGRTGRFSRSAWLLDIVCVLAAVRMGGFCEVWAPWVARVHD